MLKKRIIPTLLIDNEVLVKTTNFKNKKYIGDPSNTVRIFNELEVDELIVLDISDDRFNKTPNYKLLQDMSSQSFMPLTYGGGINNIDKAKKIFDLGFEKISINTQTFKKPELLPELARIFGSQAIICSIDYKKILFGGNQVFIKNGIEKTNLNVKEWALKLEENGAGEILLTSIDNEGTWNGMDKNTINEIAENIKIPVIAHGGVGKMDDIKNILLETKAMAVAIGSYVVYQNKGMGVLINFPPPEKTRMWV